MIRKFLPYLKAHRWPVAWALAQVFLVAGFELLKPWPLQIVIDYVLGGKTPPAGGPLGDALSLPALVVHGDEDRIIPLENGRRLAEAIPGARFEQIAGAGHLYPTDEPKADRAVLRFLAG